MRTLRIVVKKCRLLQPSASRERSTMETEQPIVGYVGGPAPPPSYPASYAPLPLVRPQVVLDGASATSAIDQLPTPSDSSSSTSPAESGDEAEQQQQPRTQSKEPAGSGIFRPVDFDGYGSTSESSGSGCFSYYPLTPTDSEEDGSPAHTGGITARLVDKELWESFRGIGNEMIVTKPGRRLFPAVLVSVRGLVPRMQYSIYLRISSADNFRYKFLGSRWVAMGESEVMQNEERQIVKHPNSPNLGSFWMKKPISFKFIKITHHSQSKPSNILLHTMHKYIMEVVIQPAQVELSSAFVIPLHDTPFIAVTSYQNTRLTQLKIDNNPFAKGFRDRENMAPLGLPSYPTSPLWQMPHLASPLQYPPLPPYQLPPMSHPGSSTLPSLYPSVASQLPPVTLPPLSISSQPHHIPLTLPQPLLPPLSQESSSPDGDTREHTPTIPPGLPAYPLPPISLPVRDAYPRPVASYPYPWGPWNYSQPASSAQEPR